jgi:arylsulfatase A-like enzyme
MQEQAVSKFSGRWSPLFWSAAAGAVGYWAGLERIWPTAARRAPGSTAANTSLELAIASAAALALAVSVVPWILRQLTRGSRSASLLSAAAAATGCASWLLLAGQVWVKNHPLVENAKSVQGLGLELQVLITSLGISAAVAVVVFFLSPFFNPRQARGRLRFLMLLLLIGVGIATRHWRARSQSPERQALAPFAEVELPPYNVLVITLDTQRADYLGCYGADVRTPVIDALAQGGAQFDRAFSTTNVTMPSHATILTSLWMKEHGLESNFSDPLPTASVTLAEVLKRVGYNTGAFTSLFILDREYSGLMQGVDTVWAPEYSSTPSPEAFGHAADWIESLDGGRFFAWVHSYDVHRPYEPVAPYDTLYYHGDPAAADNSSFAQIPPMHPRPFGVTDVDYYPAMYKGETTYQDAQLGVLFERMRAAGAFDNTLIVLTADHGESLGEHGFYYSHDALFVEDVHIPLILHAPWAIRAGTHSGALVQTIDILPTILDLLDLPALATASGKSMTPLLQRNDAQIRERAFLEGQNYRAVGIVDNSWSFIYPVSNMVPNNNVSLFRASEDPQQLVNLFYRERAIAENYTDLAEEFTGRRLRTNPAIKTGLPKSVGQQLKALGYVQ